MKREVGAPWLLLLLVACSFLESLPASFAVRVRRGPAPGALVIVDEEKDDGETTGVEKEEDSSKEPDAAKKEPDPVGCDPAWGYWSGLLDECHSNITTLETQINQTLSQQDVVIARNFEVLGKQAEDLRATHDEFVIGNKYLRPQRFLLIQKETKHGKSSQHRLRASSSPSTRAVVVSESQRWPDHLIDFPKEPLQLAADGKKGTAVSTEPYTPPRCQCVYDDKCQCLGRCQQLVHHCMALKEQIVQWGTKAYNDRNMIIAEQNRRIHSSPELEQRLREMDPELNAVALPPGGGAHIKLYNIPKELPSWVVVAKPAKKAKVEM